MTLPQILQAILAVLGILTMISQAIFWWGKWAQRHETPDTKALDHLGYEVKSLAKEISELRVTLLGQHADLVQRFNINHNDLKKLMTWQSGLLSEMVHHFYTKEMIDRFLAEERVHREAIERRITFVEHLTERRSSS